MVSRSSRSPRLRGALRSSSRATVAVSLTLLAVSAMGVVSGGALIFSGPATVPTPAATVAAHTAWNCSVGTLFWESNGQLKTGQLPTHWTAVGAIGDPLDALAYSPFSKNLYAIDLRHGAKYDRVVTVSPNGTQSLVGTVSGLPTNVAWVAGDIDTTSGIYYVSDGAHTLYGINLHTMIANAVSVPSTVSLGGDLIIQKGWLWTVSNSNVNGMSLTSSATKAFATYAPFYALSAGAMWSLPSANGLYLRWSSSGNVVKVTNLFASTALYFAQGHVSSSGTPSDGASCTAVTSSSHDTSAQLVVSGDLAVGLSPGASESINLNLANTYSTPVTLYARALSITLTDSLPACSPSANFVVNQSLTSTVTVPANTSKSLSQLHVAAGAWPKVTMIDLAHSQNACSGGLLTLHYFWHYAG